MHAMAEAQQEGFGHLLRLYTDYFLAAK